MSSGCSSCVGSGPATIQSVTPHISHLIYANDLLVFLALTMQGMWVLADIMVTFGKNTGLQLNRDKSRVYSNSSCPNKEERATVWELAALSC